MKQPLISYCLNLIYSLLLYYDTLQELLKLLSEYHADQVHNLNKPVENNLEFEPFVFALNPHLHANHVFFGTYYHQKYYILLRFVVLTNTANCSIIGENILEAIEMKKVCIGLFAAIVLLIILICVKGTGSNSEWGFEDSNDWDNKLIQIQPNSSGDFLHSDDNGAYMIYKEGTGFWEFYPSEDQFVGSSVYEDFETRSSDIYEYTVLSNDVISVTTPYEGFTIEISERLKIEDVTVFKIKDGNRFEYYLPFKFVKENKGTFPYIDEGANGYFKMYVKSSYEKPKLTTTEIVNQSVFGDYRQDNDNPSEWGFMDIEEWGSALIEIDGKNIIYSDSVGEYVLINNRAGIFDFDSPQSITPKQIKNDSIETDDSLYFQVIDNNSFTMTFDGITIINIIDRICEKSSTIFVMECEGDKMYMIPFRCLNISDFSEILELPIVNIDGEDFYKAYIN